MSHLLKVRQEMALNMSKDSDSDRHTESPGHISDNDIIEEDKGDGWTRARKQSGEEGYVPSSYVEITMEKNSKGAVTYI